MPPDRERRGEVETILADWRERRDHGEPIAPEEVIRSHPHLAGELRARFHALEIVNRALQHRPRDPPRA